jgi:hypothetical protein
MMTSRTATGGTAGTAASRQEPEELTEARVAQRQRDIDLLKAGFYLEGPVREGKDLGSWAVAARRSYFDAFVPALLEANRKPGDAAFLVLPKYWDYQSRYDLKRGRDRWELVVFGSDDGKVYAANLSDGKEAWSYEIGQPVQTSPCISAGRLIMGAEDGIIYGFAAVP